VKRRRKGVHVHLARDNLMGPTQMTKCREPLKKKKREKTPIAKRDSISKKTRAINMKTRATKHSLIR
jgi:hypothetical protein